MDAAAEAPEALNVFVTWGGAVLIAFAIISGVAGFAVWLGKRFDKHMAVIAAQLDERTSGIQDYANGNSINGKVTQIAQRQQDISREIADLKSYNEVAHESLGIKVDRVSERLDAHAASPAHDRRAERTRKTDIEE